MDNQWANQGQEDLDRVLKDPVAYQEYLKRLEGQVSDRGGRKGNKLPKTSIIAADLAERYGKQLAWDIKGRCWRHRNQTGTWEQIARETVGKVISADLRSRPELAQGCSHRYVNSTIALLKIELSVENWEDTSKDPR